MLTQEERERFALWLEREITSSQDIAHEMRKLGVPGELAGGYEKDAEAFRRVLDILRATHGQGT